MLTPRAKGTIVYFGLDECAWITLLTGVGYSVDDCGRSADELIAAMKRNSPDAVVMSEEGIRITEAVALLRKMTVAPLILFEIPGSVRDKSQFELVIPPLTPPADWLPSLAAIIERSRELRFRATLQGEQFIVKRQ